jgi:hypothetical protein
MTVMRADLPGLLTVDYWITDIGNPIIDYGRAGTGIRSLRGPRHFGGDLASRT